MNNYWESMRARICTKCIDGDGHGNCRLPAGVFCALESFFPELVSTVIGVQAVTYNDYVAALRANVCANCKHQQLNGMCSKRETLECALDRYYPIVIEIIDELSTQLKANTA
jgi:hypothetical protein